MLMKLSSPIKLLLSLGVTFVAGAIGSAFTFPSISSWYVLLDKPPFSPPNFVFGPVWTMLYILMAIAFFLIWNMKGKAKQRKLGIHLFLVQLLLNSLWSIAFFGLHSPFLGVVVIIFLWSTIVLTIQSFWKLKRTAAYLLFPYIAWVSFAGILNISVWILNR